VKNLLTSLLILSTFIANGQYVILNFEEDNLPLDTFITASASNTDSNFVFDGLVFPSVYDPSYGGFWVGGWALSTSRNDTTGDFSNLFGAVTGGGYNRSSTYLVGQDEAYILLPPGSQFAKVYVTNTTYTANVLEIGSGFSRPFGIDTSGMSGVPDSLVLNISAYDSGNVSTTQEIYLADFTPAEDSLDSVLREWRANDHFLPSYSFYPADSIAFRMYSSDNGAFGNNTPDFFAMDALYVILGTSSIADLLSTKPLKVWPNPASSLVRVGEGGDAAQLHIADMNGRVVRFYPNYNLGQSVELSSLPSGTYTAVTMGRGLNGAAQFIVK